MTRDRQTPPPEWPAPDACLNIARLRAGYGKRDVIAEVSLAGLRPGGIAALLGPNGSGKSTLLKALAGLVRPRGGAIELDGVNLAGVAAAARSGLIAYMPQDLPAAVHLRVLEAVLTSGQAGMEGRGRADPRAAQALLEQLGLGQVALRYLDELSGGQRQLAGLALALIRQPRVLLLDEPLSALDPRHQFEVMALLRRETRARGLITLMVMHDLNIALRHADHAVLLDKGAVAAEGAPEHVVRPENLAKVYGVHGRLGRFDDGTPYVLIDGTFQPG